LRATIFTGLFANSKYMTVVSRCCRPETGIAQ
jgi:hypothetical protein